MKKNLLLIFTLTLFVFNNYAQKSTEYRILSEKEKIDLTSPDEFLNKTRDLYLEETNNSIIENYKTSKALSDSTFVSESDSLVLVAFYNSTNGGTWTDTTNWLTDAVYLWKGISTSEGRVSAIELYNNNLSGTIPEELGDLTSLDTLNLGHNDISGSIPTEFGSLSNLTYLSLYNNELSGEIPLELSSLSNLIELNLSYNSFTGLIIPELGSLANLKSLNLYSNLLTGSIPAEIGSLSNLTYLNLSRNEISGTIPAELGDLNNLISLFIERTKLSGEIPAELGNLSNLSFLWLPYNELSGEIPTELGNLTNLTRIYLYDNELSGLIPPELGNLTNLTFLDLGRNNLSGEIPSELGNLSNLTALYLWYNELSGSIPVELSNLSNLTALYLWYNELSGTIPTELSNLSSLEGLALSNNQLSGSIPVELGSMTNLTSLTLNNNLLTGSIPVELGNLTNLTAFYVNNNQLSGEIPSELNNLTKLKWFKIAYNKFDALNDLSGMLALRTLEINNNYFTFADLDSTGLVFSEISSATYCPQYELEKPTPTTFSNGYFTFVFTTDGTGNTYQWFKDGGLIDGETTDEIEINNLDEGIFYCEVKNTTYPELVLVTEPIYKSVENSHGIVTEEYDALVALYNAHVGDNWTVNHNWMSDENVETWHGIQVSGGRVTSINLRSNGLTGTLQDSIGDFPALIELDLSRNDIDGNINPIIQNLETLEMLNLGYNQLSGTVPVELFNITSLTELLISNNNLDGTISGDIQNLTNLEYLQVDENQFTGNIPEEIGNMTSLTYATFSENKFTGSIPVSFNNLVNLEDLSVEETYLDSLPLLSGLTQLQYFYCNNSKFTFKDFDDTDLDYSLLSYFAYDSQDTLEMQTDTLAVSEGDSFIFNCDTITKDLLFSSNNEYIVYKDGVTVYDWSADPEYVIASFSIEDAGKYTFQVQNSDYPDLVIYSDTLTLEFNNVPSEIELSNNTIDENLTIGSIVGVFTTTDENDDTHTYSLVVGDGTNDVDNALFSIDSDTLKTNAELDYETKSEYLIYIQTEDGDGATYQKAFVIIITDVNEAPTEITLSTNSVDENVEIASVIGQFTSTDIDADDTHTYALIAGDGANDVDNASFSIDGDTLKTNVELDYETKSEYLIYIQTEDGDGATYQKAFTINVTDVTETGIENVSEFLVVFPNPSNGRFKLEFNTTNYEVKIYDVIGNVVYTDISQQQNMQIDITGIASGVYFLVIQDGVKQINKRIIIK